MSLKELEIEQEGIGKLDLVDEIPKMFTKYLLPSARAFYLEGDGIKALFQVLVGKGFRVWFSRYWTTKPVVLSARGGMATLELRMSWRNQIKGSWEKVLQAELPEYCYQFSFVPYTITRAVFEANKEYQTFDVHFDLSFFETIGLDYKMFQQFLQQVLKDLPADLYPRPKKCSGQMIEAVHGILRNSYSLPGKKWLLENNVSSILLAAFEDVDPEGKIVADISPAQFQALYEAKALIETHFPQYLGNRALCRKVGLNLTYLSMGFKKVFGENPYEFYNLMRMDRSKDLLRQGYTVRAIAMELEYETDRSFGKVFKQRFGITPKEFQLRFRK